LLWGAAIASEWAQMRRELDETRAELYRLREL
jgi:hypothetical protein